MNRAKLIAVCGFLPILLGISFLAGCGPKTIGSAQFEAIKPGMSADEVKSLCGKPHEITGGDSLTQADELWFYNTRNYREVDMSALGLGRRTEFVADFIIAMKSGKVASKGAGAPRGMKDR